MNLSWHLWWIIYLIQDTETKWRWTGIFQRLRIERYGRNHYFFSKEKWEKNDKDQNIILLKNLEQE